MASKTLNDAINLIKGNSRILFPRNNIETRARLTLQNIKPFQGVVGRSNFQEKIPTMSTLSSMSKMYKI
jgi:hypothetical protein